MGNSVTNGQKIKAKLDYIRYAISGKINKHPHINAKNIFMLCSGTWLLVTFSLFLLNYEDRQLKIEEAKIVLKNDPDLERLYRDYNYASIAGIKGVGTVEHFLQSFFQGVAALFLIYLSFVVLKILFPKLTALRIFSVKLDSREKRLSFVHGVAGAFCVFLGLRICCK